MIWGRQRGATNMQMVLELQQVRPVPLCETLLILEPWFEDQGIEYDRHTIESYEDRVRLVHHDWLIAYTIRVKGTKIIAPGGRDFDLHNPMSLAMLVAWLHILSWTQ
jgi:hypothetical protein